MTPEQHDILVKEVTNIIVLVVNGKINNMQDILKKHIEDEENYMSIVFAHIEAMQPVIETINTLQSGRRFLIWAAPVALIGSILAWLK